MILFVTLKTFFSIKIGGYFLWTLSLFVIGAGEYFMPIWVQILIGIAAVIVAIGIIWKKLLQPIARLVTLLNDVLPMLHELVKHFKDTPHAFEVLNEIIREFRTDSGTTLRDVVNRLETTTKETASVADVLMRNAETARKLAAQDRSRMAELVELVDTIKAKQRENIKTVDRMEAGDKVVASDLAASHKRAGNVDGEPGAAADAAVQKDK